MDLEAQLRILHRAHGNPASLALATIDLAYPVLAETERAFLYAALEAAAVPHWCDDAALATLLEIPREESANRLLRLRKLNVIEQFPARGVGAVNVHEASRRALRQSLATNSPERFRTLSMRAARHFATDVSLAGRIEWVFHLLCGDSRQGADELERLCHQWVKAGRLEDLEALTDVLNELETMQLVTGVARVEVLLSMAEFRNPRGTVAQSESLVRTALDLARCVNHLPGQGRAYGLLGEILSTRGELAEANAALMEFLAISRKLTTQVDVDAYGTTKTNQVHHVFDMQDMPNRTQHTAEPYPISHARSQGTTEQHSRMGILLVGHHTLLRNGVRSLLNNISPELVIREAASLEDAIRECESTSFKMVLLDVGSSTSQGIETLLSFRNAIPNVAVIVLSGDDDPQLIRTAIDCGAVGFVPKSHSSEGLIAALRVVLSGGIYVPIQALDSDHGIDDGAKHAMNAFARLNARQREVAKYLLQGAPNKVIARELGLSEGTVKAHVSAVFQIIGARNRVEAVMLAARSNVSLM